MSSWWTDLSRALTAYVIVTANLFKFGVYMDGRLGQVARMWMWQYWVLYFVWMSIFMIIINLKLNNHVNSLQLKPIFSAIIAALWSHILQVCNLSFISLENYFSSTFFTGNVSVVFWIIFSKFPAVHVYPDHHSLVQNALFVNLNVLKQVLLFTFDLDQIIGMIRILFNKKINSS